MDLVFRALADPTRRALLDALNARNGQTLAELTALAPTTRQAVSKHLAVLEHAELVVTRREGRLKRHFLNAAPIAAVAERWIRPYDRHRTEALLDLQTALDRRTPVSTDPFVYTTYLRTTPDQLWTALTDPAFTTRYWGVALTSDWTVGSTVAWEFAGARMAEPEQLVLESDRPWRLSYRWHAVTPEFLAAIEADPEEGARIAAEPLSVVTFEVEQLGDQVRLTVTHGGFEPDSLIRDGVSQGWPSILASLKSLLETGEPLSL